ncbi:MAG: hypothetical protein V1929_10735 [bacterium]
METKDASFFLSPTASFVATVIFVAMLGVVDWASGYELQFFVFYFIPVAVAAWACGARRAYMICVVSAGVWSAADFFSGHQYTHASFAIWNALIRLAAFLALGFAVAHIRALLIQERNISDQLQKTLSEVKTLTGLLPICAGCKRIRNDQGYWQQLEEYIGKHTDAEFTHGLCQECMRKILREAGMPDDVTEASQGGND